MELDSSESLNRFLKDDEIILATKNGWCRVQKSILIKHSQYFEALLTSQHSSLWKENIERKVYFDWLSIDTLVFILNYFENLNSCEFKSKTRVFQVAQASDFFNIEPLKLKASNHYVHMIGGFTSATRDKIMKVISVAAEAELCRLESLMKQCVVWLAKHFAQTWTKAEYVKLSPELKEQIYQRAVKIVCRFDGLTLIHVQDIEKLKVSLYSNPKSEGSLRAQSLENSLKQSVLNDFPAFINSLIRTDPAVSKISWLFDYLGHVLKHVCSKLTVDNICQIYIANESIRNHGMRVKWREETVLRRFSVLDDKCMNFFALNVQLIKLEKRDEWDSLPLMVKEQIDMTHHYKTNASSIQESSNGGFLFISLDDKPTFSPPASFLRHTNRPPRASRVSTDRSVQRAGSTQGSKGTNNLSRNVSTRVRKVQSNADKTVPKASSVSGRSTRRHVTSVKEDSDVRTHVVLEPPREEAAAVVPKLNHQIRPRSNATSSFSLLSSSSRLPIPTRFIGTLSANQSSQEHKCRTRKIETNCP